MAPTSSGITSPAFLPHFHRFLRKFKSQEMVSPARRAACKPSNNTSAAPEEIAGVIPVQWNQPAWLKTLSQSTMPLAMVAMAELARS